MKAEGRKKLRGEESEPVPERGQDRSRHWRQYWS